MFENRIELDDRDSWLAERRKLVMASDCAVVMGASPWKTLPQLFDEKQGRDTARPIPKELAERGHACEQSLFLLCSYDFPDWKLEWHEYDIITFKKYSLMGATLDGEILTADGKRGVLEIKTADATRRDSYDAWGPDYVPAPYMWQVAHQLIVTEADFALMLARIFRRRMNDPCPLVEERYYLFDRDWAMASEKEIVEAEKAFIDSVKENRRPRLEI